MLEQRTLFTTQEKVLAGRTKEHEGISVCETLPIKDDIRRRQVKVLLESDNIFLDNFSVFSISVYNPPSKIF